MSNQPSEKVNWRSLTQEQAQALPEPAGGNGIYFLWRGKELLYVGASTQVLNRVVKQERLRDYGGFTNDVDSQKPHIPFDRATALPFSTVREMVKAESALIKRWLPPYNSQSDDGIDVFGKFTDPKVEPMNTMNELFDRYERECIPKLTPRTQRDYLRHLKVLRRTFGDHVPGSIRPKDVGRFLDVQTGKQHRNKQVAVLSAVMGVAVGVWYIEGCDSNPCQNVRRHESRPRTRYVTDAEFSAVRAVAPEPVQIAMDLALLLGQRQGDLLDLAWIQIEDTHIELTQSKTGKKLGIRLTPAVEEVLLRARRRPPMMPRWYVIRTRTGEPYTHEGFRALWQRVQAKALAVGVIKQRFTFHDLRAKCASDKANLQDASALLGHSDLSMTRRVYDRNIRMVDPLK